LHDLIIASRCIEKLNKNDIPMKKGYFSQLVSAGKIPHHKKSGKKSKQFKYVEVVKALEAIKDPTRDAQREANHTKRKDDVGLLDENIMPKHSLANESDEDKKKRQDEMAQKFKEVEEMSSKEENAERPKGDSSPLEWNTFKVMQQGLNYEIDRKVKQRSLMPISDFKAAAEVLLSPLNQGLEDLAFKFKSKFPDVSDDKIEWLLDLTNKLKVDVQNVVV